MKTELQELFQLAAKFFLKKYKEEGGAQSTLAKELGITQSYLSSVTNGSRSASLELYNNIAENLYGPLDKFLAIGRRIKEGKDPLTEVEEPPEDPVENLIARLTYYVMDHQRIEKELSELKQFYETIVAKQQTGIIVMDKDHKVVFVNERMRGMPHISFDIILGTTPYNAEDEIPGLDISSFRQKYNDAFEKLEPVEFKNIKITLQNGARLYISGAFYPRMHKGEFEGMICSTYDTTTSYILKNLLIETLNLNSHGIGIVQQTSPGEIPNVYFMNKVFREIFDLHDVDPSRVPFPETVKRMAAGMKDGKKWQNHVQKAISEDSRDIETTFTLRNNKKYSWISNPLIGEDDMHWGRIVKVEEVSGKM